MAHLTPRREAMQQLQDMESICMDKCPGRPYLVCRLNKGHDGTHIGSLSFHSMMGAIEQHHEWANKPPVRD